MATKPTASPTTHTTATPYFEVRNFYDPAATGDNFPDDDFALIEANDDFQIVYERQVVTVYFYEQNVGQTQEWQDAHKLRSFVRDCSMIPARTKLHFQNTLTELLDRLLQEKNALHVRYLAWQREQKRKRNLLVKIYEAFSRAADAFFNTRPEYREGDFRPGVGDGWGRNNRNRGDDGGAAIQTGNSNQPKPIPTSPMQTQVATDIQDHRDAKKEFRPGLGDSSAVDVNDETNGGAGEWIVEQTPYVDRFMNEQQDNEMNHPSMAEQINPPHMAEDPAQQFSMQLWQFQNDQLRRAVKAQKQAEAEARRQVEQVRRDIERMQREQVKQQQDQAKQQRNQAKRSRTNHGNSLN